MTCSYLVISEKNIFLWTYKEDYLECGSLSRVASAYTKKCSNSKEKTQHFPKFHSRHHPNISATQNGTLLRRRSPCILQFKA